MAASPTRASARDRQQALVHRLIDDQLDALRVAAAINAGLQPMLAQMISLLRPMLAVPITSQREANEVIRQANALIEKTYQAMRLDHETSLAELADIASLATAKAVQSVLAPEAAVRMPAAANIGTTIMAGATVSEWWIRQAGTTLADIAREVRLNLANAAGTPALMANVFGDAASAGVLDRAGRSVRQIVHTSATAVANHSREDFYAANAEVIHSLGWLATLDGRTCLYCGARDGREYALDHQPIGHTLAWDEGPGAAHLSCRCVALALLSTARERRAGATAFTGTRSSAQGPVSASTTFAQWLDGKSQAFQDEYFGPGRASLWRTGHLTLSELLDMRGRPLTLAALRARVASG